MAHLTHVKGQDVVLIIEGFPVAGSTSCDISINMNSDDASAKGDDGGGIWDNPIPTYYDWSMNNESFIVNASGFRNLLAKAISENPEVSVKFKIGSVQKSGTAIISSLGISAPVDGYAKLTISLEGNSALSNDTSTISYTQAGNYLKGKQLMLFVNSSSNDFTFACSTNHSLTISNSTSDTKDKDVNDMAPAKDVTGQSITVSTENLVCVATGSTTGKTIADVYGYVTAGTTVKIGLALYNSVGTAVGDNSNWGTGTALISGDFICESISGTGANKENATFNASFKGKGKPSIPSSTPSAG